MLHIHKAPPVVGSYNQSRELSRYISLPKVTDVFFQKGGSKRKKLRDNVKELMPCLYAIINYLTSYYNVKLSKCS